MVPGAEYGVYIWVGVECWRFAGPSKYCSKSMDAYLGTHAYPHTSTYTYAQTRNHTCKHTHIHIHAYTQKPTFVSSEQSLSPLLISFAWEFSSSYNENYGSQLKNATTIHLSQSHSSCNLISTCTSSDCSVSVYNVSKITPDLHISSRATTNLGSIVPATTPWCWFKLLTSVHGHLTKASLPSAPSVLPAKTSSNSQAPL